ncbi:MAG: F0F1 ATP synthase subunit epsilon [Coxiella sp. (in: Bacteria)]|nr:MAG: F0F1 ATP synthase subunit epsilon [Coxiella sp. (in: g-proteobacteria)]
MSDAPTLELDIVSAEASLFKGDVQHLIVTGSMGELGIHPGHTALLTVLKPGQVTATLADGKEEVFYISGGMLEVQPDCVTILADTAQRAADLDEAAAQVAKERAEKLVSEKKSKTEYAQALLELAQAAAQLQAIKRLREKR